MHRTTAIVICCIVCMRPSGILLVEDNPDDVFLVCRALKAIGIDAPVTTVCDGLEAVAYLGGSGQYADRARFPIPRLMLLDLELPGMNGFEVLAWVRKNPDLKSLPVVVVTGAVNSSTLRTAYLLGANSFVVKPEDFTEYTASLKQTCDAWLRPAAVLPAAV